MPPRRAPFIDAACPYSRARAAAMTLSCAALPFSIDIHSYGVKRAIICALFRRLLRYVSISCLGYACFDGFVSHAASSILLLTTSYGNDAITELFRQ